MSEMLVEKENLQQLLDKLNIWIKDEGINKTELSYSFSVNDRGGLSISEGEYLIFEQYDIGEINPKSKRITLEPFIARALADKMQTDIDSSVAGKATINGGGSAWLASRGYTDAKKSLAVAVGSLVIACCSLIIATAALVL